MDTSSATSFREKVARHLSANALAITDAWLERIPSDDERSLVEMRDHVPDLLEDLATLVRGEGDADRVRSKETDIFRMHVRARRREGYSVHRLLKEFNALALLLTSVIDELIVSASEADPGEIREVDRLIQRELLHMGEVAARLYQTVEKQERRRLAERLSSFARALEHEIRGPLQTALAAADGLDQPEIVENSERRREHVHLLDKSLQRVADLLTETRRLTMTEQSLTEEKWVSLRHMIRDVFDELEDMARRKDVELRRVDVPEGVLVNAPRVRLTVRNLVANGIKYSDPDRGDRFVQVEYRHPSEGGPRQIVVSDNGLGIPDVYRGKIFEPGVRAHPDAGSGSGLGLAIAREVLEQRKGSLSVETAEEGSTFVIDLSDALATCKT